MESRRIKLSTKLITTSAVIAGFYTAICLIFAPLSFGIIQIRIAEALNLLAIFSPIMGIGVTLGCAISNAIGFMMGTNPMLFDVFFGTLATGIATYLTWKLRKFRIKGYPLLSALPPVIVNAIMIGAELTVLETNTLFNYPKILLLNSVYVGLGQIVPCLIIGPMLVMLLEKTGVMHKLLD